MSNEQKKISIPEILPQITKPWSPKLLANLNNEYDLKIAKLRGEFVFHSHPDTDELFYVLSGTLIMRFKEPGVEESQGREDIVVSTRKNCKNSVLTRWQMNPGDLFVVPKGLRHCPATEAGQEVVALLLEKAGTVNTGDAEDTDGLTNAVEDFRGRVV
jgi:mannose-6-phosphate isomerase-like protein (cupin superfamily)